MGNLVQINESKLGSGSAEGQRGQVAADSYVTDNHMVQQGVKFVKYLEAFWSQGGNVARDIYVTQ